MKKIKSLNSFEAGLFTFSVCLSVCLSVSLSLCPSVSLSPSLSLSSYLRTHSISPQCLVVLFSNLIVCNKIFRPHITFFYPPIHLKLVFLLSLSVCLSVCLSVSLSVPLSLSLSVSFSLFLSTYPQHIPSMFSCSVF